MHRYLIKIIKLIKKKIYKIKINKIKMMFNLIKKIKDIMFKINLILKNNKDKKIEILHRRELENIKKINKNNDVFKNKLC